MGFLTPDVLFTISLKWLVILFGNITNYYNILFCFISEIRFSSWCENRTDKHTKYVILSRAALFEKILFGIGIEDACIMREKDEAMLFALLHSTCLLLSFHINSW